MMRPVLCFFLAAFLLVGPVGLGQDQPRNVSMIELIARPEGFDRKQIGVFGYLVMGEVSILFLHREDAEHRLSMNSVPLVPSQEMRRHKEQFNGMYVFIVGTFRTVPTENGGLATLIKDITSCTVWSNPMRPVAKTP